MRIRHRYLIARASVFGCLLVTAMGTALAVASQAENQRAATSHQMELQSASAIAAHANEPLR